MEPNQYILTITCLEGRGIVHAVTTFLVEHECDIIDSRQFGDRRASRFFMRVHLETDAADLEQLRAGFASVALARGMAWGIYPVDERARVLVMASRQGHCLNDLLYRWRSGLLRVDIPVIVSNHLDLAPLAKFHGIRFAHLPVTPHSKDDAEAGLRELMREHQVDLVVLARYMQILSDDLCRSLQGKAINIHHSFLPSFKGAKPYRQAFDRGVKLVGATAHYVTPALDEGPIIEQEVIRVDHTNRADDLAAVGRDAECVALSRAVQWHCEHRVFLDDDRTVVFR